VLSDASLRGANVTGTRFDNANLRGADFTGATLTDATFVGARMRGCKGCPASSGTQ